MWNACGALEHTLGGRCRGGGGAGGDAGYCVWLGCSCAPAFQDLPSFTQNVHRLVNDLRYYRLCNDSLPPGTVKL